MMIRSDHRSGSFFLLFIPCCCFFVLLLLLLSLSTTASLASSTALITSRHSQQCLDLLNLKKGFTKLNESDGYFTKTSLPHWLAGIDCCDWEGVTCEETSGLIVSLDLSERYMAGKISASSLFNLTSLQRLNLAFNFFNQSAVLLSDFEKLADLTHLNLSNSRILVGQVPMAISRLTKLTSLDLSSDSGLKLEKPHDLGTLIKDLSNLKELYLDGVNISSSNNGTEWSRAISDSVPGLQALSLVHCSLSGPMDISSLSKLRNLSILHLDGNDLLPQVPDFFANFSSLSVLSLSECGLEGLFPSTVFQLLNLKTLDLSENWMLAGFLPEFPLNSSLESLSISSTNFAGRLPNSLGNLKSLTDLNLAGCNFSGPIPWSIGNLGELVTLDLSNNHLSGDLPPMLASSKISIIDLSDNNFTGGIPTTLAHAHHLVSLDMGGNSLTGSIPMSLFTLPILETLILADNKLSGQLQEFSNASSTLKYLHLENNNLHGKIPKSILDLSALEYLALSSNNFEGSVPELELFGQLQNLTYLDLSGIHLLILDQIADSSLLFPSLTGLILESCNLTVIPSFLKHRQNMDQLQLSINRINGIIPNWIWSIGTSVWSVNLSCNLFTDIERPVLYPPFVISRITILDLHSNKLQGLIPLLSADYMDYSNNLFTGSIPFDLPGKLFGTSFFSLSNNNLGGQVPTSICDAVSLEFLDLSDNNLSGSIPGCLLEKLSALYAKGNQFERILPQNISSSCSLQAISFYGNKLEGEIPRSLTRCKKLEFLDLGSNKLAYSFPDWLGMLPALKVLSLRENEFYGRFACPPRKRKGNHTFAMLQILDISSNNFTGHLPSDCFNRMKAMMVHLERADTFHFSPRSVYEYGKPVVYLSQSTFYPVILTATTKGKERKLVEVPMTTVSIDVSNNNFEGDLPEVIGDLKALKFLNLSLNAFVGNIPQTLGNLTDLESLDLSGNQLSGEIPNSLTSLTFLSFLNLSNNNLAGRIPQSTQFTTFPSSSFEGNPGLCGSPLSRQCINPTSVEPSSPDDLNDASHELDMEEILIWMFRGLGYGVGFALAFTHQLLFAKLKIWYKRRRFMNRRFNY